MAKKIYVVTSLCGYDNYTDIIECAFSNEADAKNFIKKKEELRDSISSELYHQIQDALEENFNKIDEKYYEDYDYEKLREGMSEEDYNNEIDSWYDKDQKQFVEDKFNVSWEAYNEHNMYILGDRIGFMITETILD